MFYCEIDVVLTLNLHHPSARQGGQPVCTSDPAAVRGLQEHQSPTYRSRAKASSGKRSDEVSQTPSTTRRAEIAVKAATFNLSGSGK